jgi:hypothetical protein
LARCEDKTIDNRLSIVKTFIAAAADRLKILSKEDQRPPRVASTELSKWIMTHGPRLAEEILRYQESVGGVFHIDHIIPLAAMSLDSIADIWSLAWHPSNLCIIPEADNLSKGAVFQEQRVRRNKLTERDFRKAEQALITQYHQWLEFTE